MKSKNYLKLLALLAIPVAFTHAVTVTWSGGGGDANWSTGANWAGSAPAAADTALFNNNTNTSVNLSADTIIQVIQFDTATLGSFSFSGSKFISNGSGANISVTAAATGTPTITFNNDIQVTPSARTTSASYVITNNSATAGLVFNGNLTGAITGTGVSAQLSFRTTNNSATTVNGIISDGVGGGNTALLRTASGSGVGTLTLNGVNTYSGGTEFTTGTIALGNKAALGTGALRFVNGSGTLQATTALTGVNAVANTINYAGTNGTATTSNAVLNYTSGSTTATLVSGTAPAVGDMITGGNSQLPLYTRIIAVDTVGGTVTLSAPAGVTASNVTVTTAPFNSSGTGTVNIAGTNSIEFSGTQNLTTVWSNGTAATQTFNVTNTGVTTFSGVLQQQSGAASVTKIGTGVLILSGANTYSGATSVTAGTLLLNSQTGSATGTSGVINVNTGATLGGNGRTSSLIAINTGGSFRVGGSTGTSTGVLTSTSTGFSALVLAATSTTVFDINGTTRGTGYDAFDTSGQISFGGDFSLNFGATAQNGTTLYDLFSKAGNGNGTNFASVTITGLYAANLSLTGTGGTAVWAGTALDGTTFSFAQGTGDLTVSAVPEPSAYAAIVGLAGLAFVGFRRRRQA